jgi:hypothetical protein
VLARAVPVPALTTRRRLILAASVDHNRQLDLRICPAREHTPSESRLVDGDTR